MCELLSPVGNMDVLDAAINSGSDAIYLSGINFGARSFAGNFTNEQLKDAVYKCHLYGIKVYVTVNTIIYESEVERFTKYIDYLVSIGVDALIMQDIGMIDLVHQTYPTLPIHISTQANIHNLEGVKLLEEIGVNRVVLPRETPLKLIREIKQNTNIEIEIFVQGALCMSYSGGCLMSSLIGSRSANRGTCAQCCRQPYSLEINKQIVEENKYLLSTKDLNTLKYIGELIDIGVDSFKIEGRMKSALYVYTATSIYRNAIDCYKKKGQIKINSKDIKELKTIFNREFTRGFTFNEVNDNYVNKNRPNHMGVEIGKVICIKGNYAYIQLTDDLNINDGIRIIGNNDTGFIVTRMFINEKEVKNASPNKVVKIKVKSKVDIGNIVLKTSDYELNKRINKKILDMRKIKINGTVDLKVGENPHLYLSDGINEVDVFCNHRIEPSIKKPLTYEDVDKRLRKLGNTVFELDNLYINMDNNIFMNIKDLNELRRNAIEKLTELRTKINKYVKCEYKRKVPKFKRENNINILVNNLDKIDKTYKNIYVDNIDLLKDNYILRIPRINEYLPNIKSKVLVSDLGGVYKYKSKDTDYPLNVVNSYSVAFLHSIGVDKITLSVELNYKQIKNIVEAYKERYKSNPNLEVVTEFYPEVMVTKYNMLNRYNIDTGYLIDRLNNKYKIKIKDNLMYIYNYKKVKLEDDYFKIGINNIRINKDM